MMISDKQELRRCVKQLVRRAAVCEASLSFDVENGEVGVGAALGAWARTASAPNEALRRACADQTPFHADAAAMFAALDAMDFPVRDLDRAQVLQREYERPAYLREVLDTLRAKCVLVRVPMDRAAQAIYEDDRFEPLLCVDEAMFIPGRYGVDYEAAAHRIADAARACRARNLCLDLFDRDILRYCVLPVCQDLGMSLHIALASIDEVNSFVYLLDAFDGVRALVSALHGCEKHLIDVAAQRVRMLVRLTDEQMIPYALSRLGTRFVPFAACASQVELMLGRWLLAKEKIWPALCDAYLPLARAGYPLESAAVERDVRRLLSGNLLSVCRADESEY